MRGLPYFVPVLHVENLGKRFGPRWIFRGLSFALGAGDALVVVGNNGSGKSTLLKLLSQLSSPTEGVITPPAGDPRTAIGVYTLEMSLYSHLTVLEHLEVAARLRGCSTRPAELLETVGLRNVDAVFASQLSTGMKARLKLALAIQADPKLLVLDEPGAGLDEAGRSILDNICRAQRQRGSLVIATNDPDERRLGNLELELAS